VAKKDFSQADQDAIWVRFFGDGSYLAGNLKRLQAWKTNFTDNCSKSKKPDLQEAIRQAEGLLESGKSFEEVCGGMQKMDGESVRNDENVVGLTENPDSGEDGAGTQKNGDGDEDSNKRRKSAKKVARIHSDEEDSDEHAENREDEVVMDEEEEEDAEGGLEDGDDEDDMEDERPKKKHKKATKAEGANPKKRKKDDETDKPTKRKGPANSYALFAKVFHTTFREANPGSTMGETAKAAGAKWKEMSEEEKNPFKAEAEKLRKEYEKETERLRASGELVEPQRKSKKPKKDSDSKTKKLNVTQPVTVQDMKAQMEKLQRLTEDVHDEQKSRDAVRIMQNMEDANISVEVMKQTGLGKMVKTLSKCALGTDEQSLISLQATQLLRRLKAKAQHQMDTQKKPDPDSKKTTGVLPVLNAPSEQKEDAAVLDDRLNPLRHKVRKRLAQELMEGGGDAKLATIKAEEVESAMFAINGQQITQGYKLNFQTLHPNLKRNSELRKKVLAGDISADALVNLDPKEMATKEKLEKEIAIKEEIMKDVMVADGPKAETDQFQCNKCKKRRCTYFQMQTRSADEPMTTFIKCLECGNNWKEC